MDLAWETDVRLAVQGDREAFARMVRQLSGELYRMARTLLGSDADCADAIQETILQAYRSITKLREPVFAKTWMFRILIRECQRVQKKQRPLPMGDVQQQPASEGWEQEMDLHAAVERLEEPLRTEVKLHYWQDLPLGDIAELIQVPEGTIKSRLHRARKLLGKWLSSPEGGPLYETR